MDPILEPLVVVPESSLTRGRRYRKLWMSGWTFGALAVVGGAFMVGRELAHRQDMRALAEARQEIKTTQELQEHTATALLAAWENQKKNQEAMSSWLGFMKDREELAKYNREHEPLPYAQRK